jgi:tagaturonate reductase
MTTKTLAPLNAEYLGIHPNAAPDANKLPVRIVQFGEGGFLRGFVDWMIDRLNRKCLFNGSITVVQPIARGMIDVLNTQDGLYTHLMRGMETGEIVERRVIVGSIRNGLNPYTDFAGYLALAHNPDLRFIVSNTTEAGIATNPEDKLDAQPAISFPAKLTQLLLERYKTFNGDPSKGFVLLPCELIDRNGDNLKRTVLETATKWNLDAAFIEWVEKHNIFTCTLVDRIVTGYPRDEAEALWQEAGYTDNLYNTSELFHLWVIEGPEELASELPLPAAGFNVIFAPSIKPYRDRKVRILNGAHTVSVLAGFLAGKNLVGENMDDAALSSFTSKAILEEVIPGLTLPPHNLSSKELIAYANAVFERFRNPYIKHALLSISLNSVSKYRARVLPSVREYITHKGAVPKRLAFGLAALIAFYRGTVIRDGALIGSRNGAEYLIKDDQPVLEAFSALWSTYDNTAEGATKLATAVLAKTEWWGKDLNTLPSFTEVISADLNTILTEGVYAALAKL